jgi:hypothetical protein
MAASEPSVSDLHALVIRNHDIPVYRPAMASAAGAYTRRGSTANFEVFYENALGNVGPTLADALIATCEGEFAQLQQWFGGATPPGLPFTIYLDTGSFGAYHAGCSATQEHCAAFDGTRPDLVRMVHVAEEVEVFAANQGNWNCGASTGEGLSRVLAAELYPAQLETFASAAYWLDNGRPDFISQVDPSDRNYLSIGCSVLFLNWLHFQLHFSWAQIVAAGAEPHLQATYQKLTGKDDAIAEFRALLDRRFPSGTPSGLRNDNPYPLHDHLPAPLAAAPIGFEDDSLVSVSWGPGRYDVFAPGTDHMLWHKWWDGSRWNGWENLGGPIGKLSSVVSWGPGRLDVIVAAPDNKPWHRAWDGGTWRDWESL